MSACWMGRHKKEDWTCHFRRSIVPVGLLVAELWMSVLPASSQGGAGARSAREPGPNIRLEAAGRIRWEAASIDPSHGASTYLIRSSVADKKGRTSGGFTLDMPTKNSRITGPITAIEINGIPSSRP